MRQLTSLDAQFLALENARQTGHVGSLTVFDTESAPNGDLTMDNMMELLAARLHLLPPLRWRLVETPFGLDYPHWVDDPHFDLEFHVREVALPAPGNDEQLAEQVQRLHSRLLDRTRPLWEMYVITGLESGYTALYTKIHHAIIDGVSGAEILGLLLDLTPEVRETPPGETMQAGRTPGQWEMLGRGLLSLPRYPIRAARALPTVLPHLDETPFATLPGAGLIGRAADLVEHLARGDGNRVQRPSHKAPRTTFNGKISPHRRWVFGQLPLADLKEVKAAFGCTINDVVVALCAGAVRRWLVDHDELPTEPLVAQIPVSVRTSEQVGTYGNRILLSSTTLFTNIADPAERLRRTSESLRRMKERHKAVPASVLQDANHFIPPALFGRAARVTFSLARSATPPWNLMISNVPGPQFPLYLAGAKLVANYPVSVITDGTALNITVQSYDGHLDFGILADRDQMPDLWNFMDWLEASLSELQRIGRQLDIKPAAANS